MKRWYLSGRFFIREIEHDPTWQRLPECAKKILRWVGWHSYLTKKSPTRRYFYYTNRQIAEQIGYRERWVKHCMGLLRRGRFIRRWYRGDSGTTTTLGRPRPPVHELPASLRQIRYWRINLKSKERPRD